MSCKWIIPAFVRPQIGQRQKAQQENQPGPETGSCSAEEGMRSGQQQLQEGELRGTKWRRNGRVARSFGRELEETVNIPDLDGDNVFLPKLISFQIRRAAYVYYK